MLNVVGFASVLATYHGETTRIWLRGTAVSPERLVGTRAPEMERGVADAAGAARTQTPTTTNKIALRETPARDANMRNPLRARFSSLMERCSKVQNRCQASSCG